MVDLGSTRGTTVNGERITKARLQTGDEIMFGDCRVVVTFMEAASEETPTPQAGAWGGRPAAVRAAADGRLRAPSAAAGLRAAARTARRSRSRLPAA